MSNIRISEKHGVNPSLMVCPLCQKDTGVALLGKLRGDAEAPRRMLDQEACDECKKHMEQGIILVEATPTDGEVHFGGGYWVVTEEAFRRIFTGEAAEQGLARRSCYIDPETVEALGLRQHDA